MKPVVLIFVHYYLPAYKCGGPVRTIENMVNHLGDQIDFRIVACDRDSGDHSPFAAVSVNEWNPLGPASVFYASRDFLRAGNVRRLLHETAHHVLYLNSFFDPKFTLLPLLARRSAPQLRVPVVIATRGELSPGALAIRGWKKMPYIALTRGLGLYHDVTWQASSDYESLDIQRVMKTTGRSIVVAPNLPAVPSDTLGDNKNRRAREGGVEDSSLRVIFLSRVSPMKNLDFALGVLAKVGAPISFDVYGPVGDNSYWGVCKALSDALPVNVRFKYHGPVEHSEVKGVLEEYDLLFLPTRGENYGHVIYEALSGGTPVLISDRTPWRDLDSAGVGWVRPLNDERAFAEVIERMASRSHDDRVVQRERARAYARRVAADGDIVAKNLSLFIDLVEI
mgnify:CR=1 FL=1